MDMWRSLLRCAPTGARLRQAALPLLDPCAEPPSFELMEPGGGGRGRLQSGASGAVQMAVKGGGSADRVKGLAIVGASMVASAAVLGALWDTWVAHREQRGWLLLGFAYYILTGARLAWHAVQRVLARQLYVTVWVDRMCSKALFDGLTEQLAMLTEDQSASSSRDLEAYPQYDKIASRMEVRLRVWGQGSRKVRVWLRPGCGAEDGDVEGGRVRLAARADASTGQGCARLLRGLDELLLGADVDCPGPDGAAGWREVTVAFARGGTETVGRDAHLERTESLVLSMRTREDLVIADKALLREWCEQCLKEGIKPPDSIVEIYGLQESSTDWTPEWKMERTRPLKDSGSAGDHFYLEREASHEILSDAKLWTSSSLRVYLVLGPPGVGKSEFTVWLAGQLKLPIYRVSLCSPKLTDDRLAQVLSQSWLGHDSLLVQVDEFQQALQKWDAEAEGRPLHGPAPGVTPGGFCEVLQGSTTLSRGVVVITGTEELASEHYRDRFHAVYRRFARTATIGWMSAGDLCTYFRAFLREFVPENSAEDWGRWEESLLVDPEAPDRRSPWARHSVSVDMLKQFLMQQVTEAAVGGLGAAPAAPLPGGRADARLRFRVHPSRREDFRAQVCSAAAAEAFLRRSGGSGGHQRRLVSADLSALEAEQGQARAD